MTSILSSISGYFSKSLVLGTFLPVVIFIVLALMLLVPYLPPDISIAVPFEGLDKEWKVIGISFIAIVISGLIYNLNIPILRIYEGYPWEHSWIGSWLKKRHRAKFDAARLRVEGMRAALRTMDTSVKAISKEVTNNAEREQARNEAAFINQVIDNWKAMGGAPAECDVIESRWLRDWRAAHPESEAGEIKSRWDAIDQVLRGNFSEYRANVKHAYPDKRSLILPTRLGNVIRSFEYYSDREYGIDSIEFWPRLVAVIPTDYAVSVDDAKTTFDFMLNSSLLSFLLASLLLITGLLYPAPLASFSIAVYWIGKVFALAALSYFFYRLSISRADAWGLLVKSAFDLYRWDLLKKLGYAQQPEERSAERKLWKEISRQAIYGDRFDKELLRYGGSSSYPFVQTSTKDLKLELTKGIKPADDALIVYLRIRNPDSKKAATEVTVADRVAEDFDFEWDSARLGANRVPTSGTNPYEFELGDLQPEAERILTYRAIAKKGKNVAVHLT